MQPPTFVFTFDPNGTILFNSVVTPDNHIDGAVNPDGTIVFSASLKPGAITASNLPGFNIAALMKLIQDVASGASVMVIIADLMALFGTAGPAPADVQPALSH
jgi:hypothetical protein